MAGLYKLGKASVSDLAKETLINRTTLYPILDKLSKKGLVFQIKIEGKTFLKAVSSQDLKAWIKRRKERAAEQAEDILEWLEAQGKSSGDSSLPEIYFYEDAETIRSLLREADKPDPRQKGLELVEKFKDLNLKINIDESKLIVVSLDENEPWGLVIKNQKILKALESALGRLQAREK